MVLSSAGDRDAEKAEEDARSRYCRLRRRWRGMLVGRDWVTERRV